jgi:serine/threonine protein kinase
LKPQNVMLGKFGETIVVDWGLAKVVGRTGEDSSPLTEETLRPVGDTSGDQTEMGAAVGTPAYMSPEQAAGRWDVIDPRSDVYGLGAVLYALLTGKPPLQKGNWPEMQQRIQRGDFPRPRQLKPDVPRPLEAVCLRAMALDPPARYNSAGALAGDVERWLADEPVSVYREPFPQRVGRWAQRNKPLVSGLLAVLVTAVIALSTSTWIISQEKAETERALKKANEAEVQYKGTMTRSSTMRRKLVTSLVSTADVLSRNERLAGAELYQLALLYALAADDHGGDEAEQYRRNAVQLLRRATVQGYFKAPTDVTALKTNPDLDRVREREDFRRFVEEAEARLKVRAP